jgi:transcription termination factor Rho
VPAERPVPPPPPAPREERPPEPAAPAPALPAPVAAAPAPPEAVSTARPPAESGAPAPQAEAREPARGPRADENEPPADEDEGEPGPRGGFGGGGGGDGDFRKKFKKDRHKGKFFPGQQQQGPPRGGGWRQPGAVFEAPPVGVLPDPNRFTDLAALAARAAEIAGEGEPLHLDELASMTYAETMAAVRQRGIPVEDNPSRMQMVELLTKWAFANKRPVIDRGHLDLMGDGAGFVVHVAANYRLCPESTYVPVSLIRKFGLRRGVSIEVQAQPAGEGERCPSALVVRSAMGVPPEDAAKFVPFEELVPYYPTKRIFLEVPTTEAPSKVDVSMRAVDILTPIGFGQRGLIVAPPRTGKTILLQGLANSVATNHPEAKLIVLLVDERPEEVTDFRRHTRGEVVSSTFDESPESHVHAAEIVSEKAKRLVERGEHVVILLDSITRLARAYNALASNSGKIMSGGLEATALQKPKRFFGAARNIEGSGSLTVMGTALVDTNSRMDDIIFEEFKGTGNMELHLDRDLVNKRIFPAINFERSGTRKEELLYHPEELLRIYGLRRIMLGVPAHEAMEMLIQRLKKTRSNAEFLLSLAR